MRLRDHLNAPQASEGPERRVLVVDDVPEILSFYTGLARRLRGANVKVTTEINSDRAIDMLARDRYDVVISDFRMRQSDGISVLQAAHERHPESIRVLMTGYHEVPTDIARVLAANVDAYVAKPLQADALASLLVACVDRDGARLEAERSRARELEAAAMAKARNLAL